MNQDSVKIQQLKHRYRNSLATKLEELDSYLFAFEFGEGNIRSRLVELHEYLHKLAGSAGMYGYDDIAKMARDSMAVTNADSEMPEIIEVKDSVTRVRDLLEQHA
jgi:hypothetical protein